MGQTGDELLATVASEHAAGMLNRQAAVLGDYLEIAVAFQMAEVVVDALEVIEIADQHRQWQRIRVGVHPAQQFAPVGQLGQLVVTGDPFHLLLKSLALLDLCS